MKIDKILEVKDYIQRLTNGRYNAKDIEGSVKCPRCYFHTIEGRHNHDNLCDPCIKTILENYPNHPSVPHIQENLAAQRKKFSQ